MNMALPRLLVITDRHLMRPSFDAALKMTFRGGARLIQLREKDLTGREYFNLALHVQELCEKYGAQLLVNSRADIARAAHTAGVHLPENDIAARDSRLSLSAHALCGVSVHSQAAAERAIDEGADYLIFGPVFPTNSHPDATPAGLKELGTLCQAVRVPVFAIGGIDSVKAAECRQAGAHGVAVISAIWKTDNVLAATQELCEAIEIS